MPCLTFKTKSGHKCAKYNFEIIPTSGLVTKIIVSDKPFIPVPNQINYSKGFGNTDARPSYNTQRFHQSFNGQSKQFHYGDGYYLTLQQCSFKANEGDKIKVLWFKYDNLYIPIEVVNISTGDSITCYKFPLDLYTFSERGGSYNPNVHTIMSTIDPLTRSGILTIMRQTFFFIVSILFSLKCFSFIFPEYHYGSNLLTQIIFVAYILSAIFFFWNIYGVIYNLLQLKYRVSNQSIQETESAYNKLFEEFSNI